MTYTRRLFDGVEMGRKMHRFLAYHHVGWDMVFLSLVFGIEMGWERNMGWMVRGWGGGGRYHVVGWDDAPRRWHMMGW